MEAIFRILQLQLKLQFFHGKRNENHEFGTEFFVHHRIVSSVKRAEFVRDTMSYVVLRGLWCDIIVLNVHAPNQEKSDDSKNSFCDDLSRLLIIFLSAIWKFYYIFRVVFCLDNVAFYEEQYVSSGCSMLLKTFSWKNCHSLHFCLNVLRVFFNWVKQRRISWGRRRS